MTLMEDNIQIRCRPEDEHIVRHEIKPAQQLARDTLIQETGVDFKTQLSIDSTRYLSAGNAQHSW